MNNKKILRLKKLINFYNLDGYVVPKNDAYFSEFASPDRLKTISNFSGSAGFAVIFKKKIFCLLMEDIQSKPKFKLVSISK